MGRKERKVKEEEEMKDRTQGMNEESVYFIPSVNYFIMRRRNPLASLASLLFALSLAGLMAVPGMSARVREQGFQFLALNEGTVLGRNKQGHRLKKGGGGVSSSYVNGKVNEVMQKLNAHRAYQQTRVNTLKTEVNVVKRTAEKAHQTAGNAESQARRASYSASTAHQKAENAQSQARSVEIGSHHDEVSNG